MNTRRGCYVHIPFCVKKCAYCDFNSFSGFTDNSVARYVDALEREISASAPTPIAVDTIFFGGGTPTAIPADQEARLLRAVLETLPVTPDAEITTEANPGTTDAAQFAALREAGFNRVSVGVQSFDASLLHTLGRIHSADDAKNAVRQARAAGFENVSVDLMFGLPRQTLTQWRDSLAQALELGTEHLSLYGLIVEAGTGFHTLRQKGRLPLPGEDLEADMYALTLEMTHAAGFAQYEISNFARAGRECRHNLGYWHNEEYYGFGCGAASYLGGARRMNIKSPVKYADAVKRGEDLTFDCETLGARETMAETIMLGLRLTREGVDGARFLSRFGVGLRDMFASEIDDFVQRGLLTETANGGICLTERGVFLASEVMMAFV